MEISFLYPIFRGVDNASRLHPLHNLDRVKSSIRLDYTMYIIGDNFWGYDLGWICLLAHGGEHPLTEYASGDGSNSESQPQPSHAHHASSISACGLIRSLAPIAAL